MSVIYTARFASASPPPDLPTLPDLTTGLRDEWTFDDLVGVADGARIQPQALESQAGINRETLGTHVSIETQRPIYRHDVLNGHDVIEFTGAGDKVFARTAILPVEKVYPVPIIRSAVFKRSSTLSEILWTGGLGTDNIAYGVQLGLPSNSLVRLTLLGTTGSIDPGLPIDDEWHVVVAVFNGVYSSITVDGVTTRGALDTHVATASKHVRDVVGSNSATTANYFTGQIASLRALSRPGSFSDVDIAAETRRLQSIYDLA